MDIRKFEIDLYWKRASYFWAFIAAIFAVYWIVLTKNTNIINSFKNIALIIISIIGYIFSFSWYLVNRGSKYWQ
jgi:hypothetical protein